VTTTAIVVAHDSASVLPACLAALNREGARVVVVDNASRDASRALAEQAGARVVSNPKNQGFGRACNIGGRDATTQFLLFINPDCVLEPGALGRLLEAAERYSDAVMFAPRTLNADGSMAFGLSASLAPRLAVGPLRPPDGDCCIGGTSGAAMLVRRAAFAGVGGFDENIFLYAEDDDLNRRLIDAGGSLIHVHAAVATHAHGKSSPPSRALDYRKRWHLAWSRCYVARKHGRPSHSLGLVARSARQWLFATLAFRRDAAARHAGALAGAWAFARGRMALAREGLA
jgi:N-acetylglucosaminyl-diphospho-decaprenol L-rhamnosyltransferase